VKKAKTKKLIYEQLEVVQIDTDKLQEGMFVCRLDRPWKESPFVFQGFILKNKKDIAKVQKHCQFVYIDVKKSIVIKQGIPGSVEHAAAVTDTPFNPSFSVIEVAPAESDKPETTVFSGLGKFNPWKKPSKQANIFPAALKTSIESRLETGALVKSIMNDIRLGKSVDTPAAREAVAACVDNVMMNQDASLLLTRLRNKDEYTSEHSLNVAIISIAFGRHIGMDRKELNILGLCGLLHDMGKMLTPLEILNKPGKLDKEERSIMRRHPEDGREILLGTQDVCDIVINTAYAHHERLNGEGYPRGVPAGEIPLYTRIVTIADVFDAITGDRSYKRGETAETALGILHRGSGHAFDENLVLKFIQNIGTYPLGTIIEMTNGEIGIVVDNNPDHRLRPTVKLLLSHDKEQRKPETIDLAQPCTDITGMPYHIKTSHKPGSFRIDLSQHIQSYVRRR
jgi:putative nucleotidyltransferase with HDIG domain